MSDRSGLKHILCWTVAGVTFLAAIPGCTGLRLYRPLTVRHNDWTTFANSTSHTNSTSSALTPPLTQEWDCEIGGGIGNGSPLVIDSVLLIGSLHGELVAIAVKTGKRIGHISLGDAIQGSPVIDGPRAIVATSNSKESLVSYDLVTGMIQWKHNYGDIEVTPLLLGQRIFVGSTAGEFSCANRSTGEPLWQFQIPDNTRLKGIRSSPASEGTLVVFGSDNGVLYALNPETGKQQWGLQTSAGIVAAPSIRDGMVFVGNIDGRMYAVEQTSGRVHWSFDGGAPIYAGTCLVDSLVIFGTTGGAVFALQARDGTLAWKVDLGNPINANAVAAGRTVYVGTLKRMLFALNVDDGSVLWKKEVEGRIKTPPAVAYGRLFIATDERLVLSFSGAAQ